MPPVSVEHHAGLQSKDGKDTAEEGSSRGVEARGTRTAIAVGSSLFCVASGSRLGGTGAASGGASLRRGVGIGRRRTRFGSAAAPRARGTTGARRTASGGSTTATAAATGAAVAAVAATTAAAAATVTAAAGTIAAPGGAAVAAVVVVVLDALGDALGVELGLLLGAVALVAVGDAVVGGIDLVPVRVGDGVAAGQAANVAGGAVFDASLDGGLHGVNARGSRGLVGRGGADGHGQGAGGEDGSETHGDGFVLSNCPGVSTRTQSKTHWAVGDRGSAREQQRVTDDKSGQGTGRCRVMERRALLGCSGVRGQQLTLLAVDEGGYSS